MPEYRLDITDFGRGMITDRYDVPGSLQLCDDVVIRRDGEIRQRGGKNKHISSVSANADFSSHHAYHPEICEGLPGHIVAFKHSSLSAYGFAARENCGASFTDLGTSLYKDASNTISLDKSLASATFPKEIVMGQTISTASNYRPVKWGGSLNSAYSTGTITTCSGNVITGSGTTWTGNADDGMYLFIRNATYAKRYFRIISVDSNTQITVDGNPGNFTGQSYTYTITPLGLVAGTSVMPVSSGDVWANSRTGIAAHGGRLFLGSLYDNTNSTSTSTLADSRIRWSGTSIDADATAFYSGIDYFQTAAYADVFPGVGGSIIGLVSLGRQLVILKENAVAVLTGDVASDGTDLGASIDLVSRGIGCRNMYSYTYSPMGVVFGNAQGLYVCDGSRVQNILTGRAQEWWNQNVVSGGVVSCVESSNRIVVKMSTAGVSGTALVYDYENDRFTTQYVAGHGRIVSNYTSGGVLEGELAISHDNAELIDYAYDFLTTNSADEDTGADGPYMSVITQPIPLGGKNGVATGRAREVFVNGYVSGSGDDITVYLVPGRKGVGISDGSHSTETVNATARTNTTKDETRRYGVAGDTSEVAAQRIYIQGNDANADTRIYGVGLKWESDQHVSPE